MLVPKLMIVPKQIPLPFPSRSIPAKKVQLDFDLLETFRRVEVNIPFLDAIEQILKYAKFLKDLCTHKRKLKGNEQVKLGRMFPHLYIAKVLLPFHHPPCHRNVKVLLLLLSLVPLEIALS